MVGGFGPHFKEIKMSLQEKFQITAPPVHQEDDKWVSFESQRVTGESGRMHRNGHKAFSDPQGKFNCLPPGRDIAKQVRATINEMSVVQAGASDVSRVDPSHFECGYSRYGMKGTDDQYTGEHMDHFYGEVVDEDDHSNVGFAERNNYLDRI